MREGSGYYEECGASVHEYVAQFVRQTERKGGGKGDVPAHAGSGATRTDRRSAYPATIYGGRC